MKKLNVKIDSGKLVGVGLAVLGVLNWALSSVAEEQNKAKLTEDITNNVLQKLKSSDEN